LVILAVAVWAVYVTLSLRDSIPVFSTPESHDSRGAPPRDPAASATPDADVDPTFDDSPVSAELASESLVAEPAAEPQLPAPLSAVPAAPHIGPGWEPISLRHRCSYQAAPGVFPGPAAIWDTSRLIGEVFSLYNAMTDEQLQALADSGTDGLAQYIYAYDRLLDLKDFNVAELSVSAERILASVGSLDDERFKTARDYFIQAIRNHSWLAAHRLASIYAHFDLIEARAWYLIYEKGNIRAARIAGFETVTTYSYTPEEKIESERRAENLIAEHDLAEGLTRPVECR
jgi:hypothetical protein